MPAMTVYLAALVFGAILLAASAWKGGSASAGDADADHDTHTPNDTHEATLLDGPLALVLSVRFWTFGLAFFGLTGLALEGFALVPSTVVPFVAAAVGAGCGLGAAQLLRALARGTTGALPDAESHVGREGRVLLPIARGQRGKVRIRTAAGEADFVAELDASQSRPLRTGERIWIVAMRGSTALVATPPHDLAQLADVAAPIAEIRDR